MLKNLRPWDKENVEKVIYFLKKYNGSFIDCGCNFGAYSIPIAKEFKHQNVYAFDASKKKDGVPVDDKVAAHFLAIIPLFPTPEIIILPFLLLRIKFTTLEKDKLIFFFNNDIN